jgi:hypothetical protein
MNTRQYLTTDTDAFSTLPAWLRTDLLRNHAHHPERIVVRYAFRTRW